MFTYLDVYMFTYSHALILTYSLSSSKAHMLICSYANIFQCSYAHMLKHVLVLIFELEISKFDLRFCVWLPRDCKKMKYNLVNYFFYL